MSYYSLHTAAFILSLIGGIVIVVGSVIAVFLSAFGSPYGTYYGMGPGMMSGYWFGYGYSLGWMIGLSVAALVCGVLVVIGAFMLNARLQEHTTWGIVVLIFSVASLVGMGGYFIGAVLGIAGGAIALAYRSNHRQQNLQ